jgi:intracellular sulfur oxidation DsrE/DsrF family protein
LRAFHSASANPDLSKRVGQFSKAGLELAVCGNNMKSQNVAPKDLLPGFIVAERGGVVRIAELQSQGYLYLRP